MCACAPRYRGRFIPEIQEELDLVEQECLYREIVADLVTHIFSQVRVALSEYSGSPCERGCMYEQGFRGVAGRVDSSSVAASLPPLERCVALTEEQKKLRHCGALSCPSAVSSDRCLMLLLRAGVVRWLLRDAKLLLKARSCRLQEDWPGACA